MKQLLLATWTLIVPLGLIGQDKSIHGAPYIEVTGEGEIKVSPDEIFLTIVINEQDKGRESLEEKEWEMVSTLRQLGIEEDQLEVQDFDSYWRSPIVGPDISLSKRYQLKVTDTEVVPKVYRALEAIKISNVYFLKADHSMRKEFEKEVKIKAVNAAKEKAEYMLAELGHTVGRTLLLSEQPGAVSPPRPYRMEAYGAVSRAVGVEEDYAPLDFREITFRYSVQVRFEID